MILLPMEQRLQESLNYDPLSGLLSWRNDRPETHFYRSNDYKKYLKKQAGKELKANTNSSGYPFFRFQYSVLTAHRAIFAIVQGTFPIGQIDHINGVRTDNRWCNLREVPLVLNSRNKKMQDNNTSGYAGVSYHKHKKSWTSRVCVDGAEKHLGGFSTAEEAYQVRMAYLNSRPDLGYTKDHGHRRAPP